MSGKEFRTYLSVSSLAVAAFIAPSAWAVDFSGERIELVVPYGAGGGTGLYARFLAPLLEEKLPGNPTIIINNIEGAGAIAGSNHFQQNAEPDGLSLIAIAASVTANYVFRDERVQYKLDEWIPILSSPAGTVVYANTSLGIDGPEDIGELRDKQLTMGAGTPSGGEMRALLALDMLGLDVQTVFGLDRGDARPAFERGEFNINFDSAQAYPTQVEPLVESGVAVPLFSLGIANAQGEIVRDPIVPDLPTFVEVYREIHGEEPSGPADEAWLAIFNLNVMASKALALPAGTPDDIVETYRQAMQEVVAELETPEHKEQADEIVGPYPQALGEEAVRVLRAAISFDDETLDWIENWLEEKYGPQN